MLFQYFVNDELMFLLYQKQTYMPKRPEASGFRFTKGRNTWKPITKNE